jgi:hypothetical protein
MLPSSLIDGAQIVVNEGEVAALPEHALKVPLGFIEPPRSFCGDSCFEHLLKTLREILRRARPRFREETANQDEPRQHNSSHFS